MSVSYRLSNEAVTVGLLSPRCSAPQSIRRHLIERCQLDVSPLHEGVNFFGFPEGSAIGKYRRKKRGSDQNLLLGLLEVGSGFDGRSTH